MTSAPEPPFVAVDRAAWAGLVDRTAASVPHAAAPTGAAAVDGARWAGDVDLDEQERHEVLAPLSALALRRRRLDLDRRAALGALHPALVRGGPSAGGWVVAVAGGVAAGKSTVARALVHAFRGAGIGEVAHVGTDGFLFSNAELDRRGLTARKGFPESYDTPSLLALLRAVRAGDGPVRVPVYSHRVQDRVEADAVVVDRPAVLVLEGLRALAGPPGSTADGRVDGPRAGDAARYRELTRPSGPAAQAGAPSAEDGTPGATAPSGASAAGDAGAAAPGQGVADLVDLGVYVDAAEDDARAWYLERFRAWRVAAADDPGALLHRIADMPDADADALALRVWAETNAPNVRDHVLPTRARADVVLQKGLDHRVERVLMRPV